MPTFYLRTYGCQMNERDSEALACLLTSHGYTQVETEDTADVLLFNTCSVRDQAERKVVGKVGILKRLKKQRPGLVIGIIGCMAQNRGRSLLDDLPHVDLVVGTDCLAQIPAMLDECLQGTHGLVATEVDNNIPEGLNQHRRGENSAYVAVMRGCNQFCSYCIVPYTRGREKSRPIADVVGEVERLAANGTQEIFLLGQNITAYGLAEARKAGTYDPEASPFADLLRAVHEVSGVRRVRFTSPHVKFMNDAFVEAVTSLPKVCKSFHIPVQSGSDRILRAMKRGYTSAEYLDRVRQIRERLDEVAFSTDVIVGFPGETEEDFKATRDLMNEVGFDMAYIFRYSVRTGTKAAENLPDDVPEDVKMARNQLLLADLDKRVKGMNARYVGRDLEVLVEGPSKRNSARWTGRSDTNKVVIFEPVPELKAGDFVTVHIDRTTSHSLFGQVR
jgi:tRNA-2-methylthio-N6-dimethylallyladenosine synthase